MGTIILIAIALATVAGLAIGGRHVFLKAMRPGGFECSLRVLEGSVPGLSKRFRAGYAGKELDAFVWRRMVWPSPPVAIPASAVRLDRQLAPRFRENLLSVPAHFAILTVELPDGPHLELAVSPRRLKRIVAVLG